MVTATNDYGSASIRSWLSATIVSPPINTVRPGLTGMARQGEALSALPGSWVGAEPMAYGYQWRRCEADGNSCANIGGAVVANYTLKLDRGRQARAGARDRDQRLRIGKRALLELRSRRHRARRAGLQDQQPCRMVARRIELPVRHAHQLQNEQFRCDEPLSTYGPLPIKVVWTFTGTPDFGDQGHVDLINGCRGDANPDTIDLIIDSNADGVTVGARGGAGKFRTAGPRDIQVTGKFDCGPLGPSGAHQDVWQFHPSHPNANLAIVNGYSGNWNAGTSTCIGAGGAIFWSDQYDIDVYGGKYVTCNHGLFGAGQDQSGNVVDGASFRTGRVEPVASGGDPVCQGFCCVGPVHSNRGASAD